jgi:V/A-type H+-transporting ATPase subunit C
MPRDQIRFLLVPAGDLDAKDLENLLELASHRDVFLRVPGWSLTPVLERECRSEGQCLYSRLEESLYRQYYSDLLSSGRQPVRGYAAFSKYIRVEIDLLNFRTILRLRSAGHQGDIEGSLIAGGNVTVHEMARIAGIQNRDEFISSFQETDLLPLAIEAYNDILIRGNHPEKDVVDYISDRGISHRRPRHEVEMAVSRVRLRHLSDLSKRHPFSVLPVVAYLEHKKFEVFNLRAIIRGIEKNVPPDVIRQYLVV